jgi:predicted enzyme related to lactoylglutathione lyase
MPAPIVFLDFAGPDQRALQNFYGTLFGWNTDAGEFSIPVGAPLPAAVRQDPAEKRVYVGVEDVRAKLDEIRTLGGVVERERFEVPGVVVLGLFRDPAGNPMGLVEMDDGAPRIP